jgi:DNA-directed RNA polymerase subunit L
MNLEIVKAEKSDMELKIDNPTIAEIMRVYLNQDNADLAVWRREHPFKPLTMKIQSSNVKKSVSDAVKAIKSDLDKLSSVVKKAK